MTEHVFRLSRQGVYAARVLIRRFDELRAQPAKGLHLLLVQGPSHCDPHVLGVPAPGLALRLAAGLGQRDPGRSRV
jgi:hypothetical protein